MKPIFGIDITLDKKNDTINGEEFITNTIVKERKEEFESKQENLNQTIEDSQLPLWLRIIKYVSGLYALAVFAGIARALSTTDVIQAFQNAPFLFISSFACALIWALLQFAAKKQEKRVMTDQDAEHQIKNLDSDMQNIYFELNVPFDAASADVLVFKYKIKNGKVHAKAIGFQTTPYVNVEMKLFVTTEHLCLADLENVYSFKFTELKGIKKVNKRIPIPLWNKEERPTKGEFKQYKMVANKLGDIIIKSYYILEGEHDGEPFGIYFPCYELSTFERLTGLKANEA